MNIAILGCGTVASGVCRLIAKEREGIARALGEPVVIRKILARTSAKARALGFGEEEICSDMAPILADPTISVVVELIGGTGDARTFVEQALRSGKHVVTANKDLIALRYGELLALARENGVSLLFEASVGGGIPLIEPLRQTLALGGVRRIYGILNGTTNFILTRMARDGMGYADALSLAQKLGYAEADPRSDVDGLDAGRKIAILATLAFHSRVTFGDVACEGISAVTETDVAFAARTGRTIKLLGVAQRQEDGVTAYVRPALVPNAHPLASVSDAYNAAFLQGDAVGDVMLYGQGAGAMPTANSVLSDILRAARTAPVHSDPFYEDLPVHDEGGESVYYVRLLVQDRPKVLSGIAGVFGEYGISLASLVQETRPGERAELMLFTHAARERDLRAAMEALLARGDVHGGCAMICLEEKT